ncbi:MAG TPA: DUF1385 domain-containing protein [Firmicutes bacterium]|nr:DUF1385 domain-containing protein [Bacillota bacterium]
MASSENKKKKQAGCPREKMNIGGQAVIEGVFMRSKEHYSVAVMRKNGKIEIMTDKVRSLGDKWKFLKWPFLRGFLNLVEQMVLGYKALDWSAKIYEQEWEKEEKAKNKGKKKKNKKPPKKLTKEQKERKEKLESVLTFAVSMIIAVVVFIYVPVLLTKLTAKILPVINENRTLFNTEIVFWKLLLFFLYVWGISFMEDVRRLFMYHGAEHKAIYAFEDNRELTLKNMKKYTTLHPRCGTAFIFITLLVSIVVFILLLPPEFPVWKRILYEIPLLIPIAGISYEVLKLSARFKDNFFVNLFIAPGLAFQRITTKEPEDKMLLTAARAIKEVMKLEKKRAGKRPAPRKNPGKPRVARK